MVKIWSTNYSNPILEFNYTSTILKLVVIRDHYLIGISSQKNIIIWNILNFTNTRYVLDNQVSLSVSVLNENKFITRYETNRIRIWNFNSLTYNEFWYHICLN